MVIVVPFGEKKEKPFSPEGTDLHGDYDYPIKVVIKIFSPEGTDLHGDYDCQINVVIKMVSN